MLLFFFSIVNITRTRINRQSNTNINTNAKESEIWPESDIIVYT